MPLQFLFIYFFFFHSVFTCDTIYGRDKYDKSIILNMWTKMQTIYSSKYSNIVMTI